MTDEKIGVLVVGVGSIGERHLRCFAQSGRVDVSICEPNAALRQEVARRYGVTRQFDSLDAALGDRFDAAVIATPAHLHVPMAARVVDRGMHALIEKPLSTSNAGIASLIERVEERAVTAAVAYVMRCHPAANAVRDAVRSERFGKPLQVVAHLGQDFPFFRPAYAGTYYAKRETGGGAIQDALTHIINLVQWIVGPMDRVMADAGHLSLAGVSVEDTVHVIARHGETMVTYALNQHQAPNESRITIACEHGTLRAHLVENSWAWQADPRDRWHQQAFADLQRDDLFVTQAEAFLDAVQGEARPLCTLEEAWATLTANLAVLASSDAPPWTELSQTRRSPDGMPRSPDGMRRGMP